MPFIRNTARLAVATLAVVGFASALEATGPDEVVETATAETVAVERANVAATLPELLPPVQTHTEALRQCDAYFAVGQDLTDCYNAAYAAWGVPLPGAVDWDAVTLHDTDPLDPGVVIETVEAGVANEDQPGWDCRSQGNARCGVWIVDQYYVVDFIDGYPVAVAPRGF